MMRSWALAFVLASVLACSSGSGVIDTSPREDAGASDASAPRSDAMAPDSATPGCAAAGGVCGTGPTCPGEAPAIAASCGSASEVCCEPASDGGHVTDGSTSVSCAAAGGHCNSAGTVCLHGSVATRSCGDPSVYVCCAP